MSDFEGYLRDRAIPSLASDEDDDALNQLERLGYQIDDMTIAERAQAMIENGIQASVDFFNAAGGGLAAMGVLAEHPRPDYTKPDDHPLNPRSVEYRKSKDANLAAAVDVIEGVGDERDQPGTSPFQYEIEDPESKRVEEALGMLADPVGFGVKKAGSGILEMTGSAGAAVLGESILSGMLPGGRRGGGGRKPPGYIEPPPTTVPELPKPPSKATQRKNKRILDRGGEKIKRPTKMTDVPSLRGLDVDEAVEIAKYEPHLIEGGAASEGKYVGGPRDIKSRRGVTEQRKKFDAVLERGVEGSDWYTRYRNDVREVTGLSGDNLEAKVRDELFSMAQNDALWMSNMEAQYSAGVDPGAEVGFTIKDTNSSIAYGKPTKAARPAQQEATMRAIAANDPSKAMLGEKTGEYARLINPAIDHGRQATGVNDIWTARLWGHKEADGRPWESGLSSPQHTYLDYETAGAVGRANEGRLAGRDDWTGEQVQAAAWVEGKAQGLYEKRKNSFHTKAREMIKRDGLNEPEEKIAMDLAFKEANKTIGDFYDKHTAFATHEQQPFVDAGHLPGLGKASLADRNEFANDPLSSWDIDGRDAIYAGARLGDTGIAMRTRPTTDMQGAYLPPSNKRDKAIEERDAIIKEMDALLGKPRPGSIQEQMGAKTGGLRNFAKWDELSERKDAQDKIIEDNPPSKMEFNPGKVARPLVGFQTSNKGTMKTVPDADRSLLNAGESIRAAIDVQGAGAWHKGWAGLKVGDSNSVRVEREGGRLEPSNPDELQRMQKIAKDFGFEDVVDTGNGFTFTTFYGGPKKIETKVLKKLVKAVGEELPRADVKRTKIDSGYMPEEITPDGLPGFENEWTNGGVTNKLLVNMDKLPEGTRAAMDNNPHIPQIALNKLERDEKYAEKYGATREDVQNLRRIIGEGPGWMDRLKKALQAGVVLPALAVLAMGIDPAEDETAL